MAPQNNMQKYLPSKKFIRLTLSFIVVGVILFIASNFIFSKKLSFFSSKKENANSLATSNLSMLNLVQADTDSDGVADWEEALWGTDKNNKATFDGITDLKYIEAKKKELNVDQKKDSGELTETEKFAREFFTAYMAMKSSGGVDNTTINNFSSALGEKMANPNIIDQYSEKDVKIDKTNNGEGDLEKYYLDIQELFDKYRSSDIGDELNIISSGLMADTKTNKEEMPKKLADISNYYQELASKMMDLSVPKSLTSFHLKTANSANNTGISVKNMITIQSDPIVGLSGLSQYKKYSEEFINSATELETKILE